MIYLSDESTKRSYQRLVTCLHCSDKCRLQSFAHSSLWIPISSTNYRWIISVVHTLLCILFDEINMEHVERIDYTKFADQLDVYLHITRYRLATQAMQGSHILDVGCGYGYGTKQMAAAHPDKQFVAIDIDAQVISYAKAHNALPNITYMVMSATALDLPDNTFSTVISVENIEHIDDVQTYAHELARVLIPGGSLFLTTPNDDRLPHRVQRICNATIIYNKFHVKEYTLGQLNQLRASVGLVCQKKR